MTDARTAEAPAGDGEPDPVTAFLAAADNQLIDALNTDFDDSILLVARWVCERPEAVRGTITGVDSRGFDLVVADPAGDHPHRIDFDEVVTDPNVIASALFTVVARARTISGEPGTTSAERVMAEVSGIRTLFTTVSAVEDVHPHLRMVTFRGGDLETFAPLGPDTFLYLLLPPPGRAEMTIGRDFSWEQVPDMPEEERPVGAYYTLRAWRPAEHELDILMVLHGDAGPASAWAMRAKPGDPVALWGPRTAYHPPADTDWWLLVADETGLPGVATILEQLPEGAVARVFAEVDNEAERQELPEGPGFEVTWLYREGAEPGSTSLLPDAVRALEWPGGTPYAWGGAESRTITKVRKYVRQEVGLSRDAVSLVGYWRREILGDTSTDDLDEDED
jgi:NADPH-dependent ferric siderophore reductase